MNLRFVSVFPDRDMAMRISFERRLSVIRLGERKAGTRRKAHGKGRCEEGVSVNSKT